MIRIVPTLHGDAVTTARYTLLFDLVGPGGPEEYQFSFKFNRVMDRWVLSIRNSQGQDVVIGAPVVLGGAGPVMAGNNAV